MTEDDNLGIVAEDGNPAKDRERREDWIAMCEEVRRTQLGNATTLTFGLAAGGLGFCASLLTSKDAPLVFDWPANYVYVTAVGLFIISVVLSIGVILSRLHNYRLLVRKLFYQLWNKDKREIEKLRQARNKCAILTNWLFHLQLLSFVLAVFSLILVLWMLFRSHLFPHASS